MCFAKDFHDELPLRPAQETWAAARYPKPAYILECDIAARPIPLWSSTSVSGSSGLMQAGQ